MLQTLPAVVATADPTPGYVTPDTIVTGVNTTVIGMVVVFIVLIVLMIVISVISGLSDKKRKQKAAPAPAVAAGIPPQTVAVIVAAICAASGRDRQQLKFTAIRRSNNNWNKAGTTEIIDTRQQYL